MFRSVNNFFYRGVNGVGLVFDLTNKASLINLDSWLAEFIQSQGKEELDLSAFAFILIGNKNDLPNQEVTDKMAWDWCLE